LLVVDTSSDQAARAAEIVQYLGARVSPGTRKLVLRHAHEDDDMRQALKDQLERSGYTVHDEPLDGDEPQSAGNEPLPLAPCIDEADTLVVLISPVTPTHPSVEREIEYAVRRGKRIVGVYFHGGQVSHLPENFHKYGDALVVCQPERVLDAVSGTADTWFQPDDTEFPERNIERFPCGEKEPE
jgi:hypothetical protein